MKLRKRKTVLILICLFNLFQALDSKNHLRKTWEEVVKYDKSRITDPDEKDAVEKCEDSDYKYFIHFVTGNNVIYDKGYNRDNAVSYIFIIFCFRSLL